MASHSIYTATASGSGSFCGCPALCCCEESCCPGGYITWDVSDIQVPAELVGLYEPTRLKQFADKINNNLKHRRISMGCKCVMGIFLWTWGALSALCLLSKQRSTLKQIIAEENKNIHPLGLAWEWCHPMNSCIHEAVPTDRPDTPLLRLNVLTNRIDYENLHPEGRRLMSEIQLNSKNHIATMNIVQAPTDAVM
jgi:hypothetical protein